MDKNDIKNIMIAIALSLLVLFVIDTFFPETNRKIAVETSQVATTPNALFNPENSSNIIQQTQPILGETVDSPKVAIRSDALQGSIRLKGATFDALTLVQFKKDIDPDSPDVTLLMPSYYVAFGISSLNNGMTAPNQNTLWTADKETLTPDSPLTLTWQNQKGVVFKQVISMDKEYMFTIVNTIENKTTESLWFSSDGTIVRIDPPEVPLSSVHEGFVGVLDGSLKEFKMYDFKEGEKEKFTTKGGWLGITEKYWLTALIFDKELSDVQGVFSYGNTQNKNVFSTYYVTPTFQVKAGESASKTSYFFAGPKEEKILAMYQKDFGIEKFELAIDFGWFYFLTKPFLFILSFLNHLVGNMGLAILIFASILRLLLFPIAGKSFENMAKMRKLQPKVKSIQELYKDNKMRMQQEMMLLYKKEKVNPASGCLPLLIQIPIFFSLYKVLSVSIEMRQAPFYGWIHDLSVPDPSSFFTLFGLIPWDVPTFLNIGVWPMLMGLTMFLQQKMNPALMDKTQAMIFKWMPLVFVFMLGQFASGLVIYWTWNNILSIIQQHFVMKKYKVD